VALLGAYALDRVRLRANLADSDVAVTGRCKFGPKRPRCGRPCPAPRPGAVRWTLWIAPRRTQADPRSVAQQQDGDRVIPDHHQAQRHPQRFEHKADRETQRDNHGRVARDRQAADARRREDPTGREGRAGVRQGQSQRRRGQRRLRRVQAIGIGIRKALEKLARRGLDVQADGLRVRAHERSPEDPGRPFRNIVPLEILEQRRADLAVLGDRRQRDLTPLALAAQTTAKTLAGVVCRGFGHVGDAWRGANRIPPGCERARGGLNAFRTNHCVQVTARPRRAHVPGVSTWSCAPRRPVIERTATRRCP